MRIWYQSYSKIDYTRSWAHYETWFRRQLPRVARPDTEIYFHGADKFTPKLPQYYYYQYLHLAQIIEAGLQAEREGYDAFVLGGMLDHGRLELREVLNIPVLFIGETSFYVASQLSSRFAIVAPGEVLLRGVQDNVRKYGLGEHMVEGVHLGAPSLPELVDRFVKEPKAVIDMVAGASTKAIERGADMLVPGYALLSLFLADQGAKEVNGVPILDNTGVLVRTAEYMVDLKRSGITRSRVGGSAAPPRDELKAVQKLYGAG